MRVAQLKQQLAVSSSELTFTAAIVKVREHSSMELCGPHVAISAAILRSSDGLHRRDRQGRGRQAAGAGEGADRLLAQEHAAALTCLPRVTPIAALLDLTSSLRSCIP